MLLSTLGNAVTLYFHFPLSPPLADTPRRTSRLNGPASRTTQALGLFFDGLVTRTYIRSVLPGLLFFTSVRTFQYSLTI